MSGVISRFSGGDKSGITGHDKAERHTVMDVDMNQTGHRSTTSSTPTNTGVAGSFVTKHSSAVSYFVVHWHCSMYHINNATATSQIKICMRTGGSNTTYVADDDLNANQYGWYFYFGLAGTHIALDYHGVFKAGSATCVNMTSYLAGATVDVRVFGMGSAGTIYFPHQDGWYILEATEYLRSKTE